MFIIKINFARSSVYSSDFFIINMFCSYMTNQGIKAEYIGGKDCLFEANCATQLFTFPPLCDPNGEVQIHASKLNDGFASRGNFEIPVHLKNSFSTWPWTKFKLNEDEDEPIELNYTIEGDRHRLVNGAGFGGDPVAVIRRRRRREEGSGSGGNGNGEGNRGRARGRGRARRG
ncbi:hypothetical protein ACQ4LE_001917 [Meloidogyne hapla]|uniref:Uncharacterized protein n=1 Tax=Meloidogyne hapla TaxID=6305 RepID=A0A1I8BYQ9_MELHA